MLVMKNDSYIVISPTVAIVPTVPWHINALKENLRAEDAAEILSFGVTVQKALWYSYKYSLVRKTALIDGEVAACWGCGGVFMGSTGQPWLITTPEVRKVSPLKFCRIYQQEVLVMLKLFPRLEHYVDLEYSSAVRLLKNTGFTVHDDGRFEIGR